MVVVDLWVSLSGVTWWCAVVMVFLVGLGFMGNGGGFAWFSFTLLVMEVGMGFVGNEGVGCGLLLDIGLVFRSRVWIF